MNQQITNDEAAQYIRSLIRAHQFANKLMGCKKPERKSMIDDSKSDNTSSNNDNFYTNSCCNIILDI